MKFLHHLSSPNESKKSHKRAAATFALNNGADYHKAFGTLAVYNEDSEEIEPLPGASDLEESLKAYNDSVDPEFRFEIEKCTFENVMSELDHAQEAYTKKARGPSGALRKVVRGAGDFSDQITPWLGLIPSDYGLGFLTAGLTIIFSIAKQNSSNRGKILGAFKDIPELMLSVKAQQNQWASAKALRESARELYDTVARALASLILLLNGSMSQESRISKRARKLVDRLFAAGNTAKLIDGILAGVQKQAQRFRQCLDHVRDDLAIQTRGDVASTKAIAGRSETTLNEMKQDSQKMNTWLYERVQELVSGICILNTLCQSLQDNNPCPYYPTQSGSSQPPPPYQHPKPLLSDIELFDSLGVDQECPSNDLQMVIKDISQFEVSAQAQAQQLFASRQFAEWMASNQRATLLVHGNFETPGPGRTTALSVLCAMFALQLHNTADKNHYIVLHHFCGLHGSSHSQNDPIPGPNGLIRSLITQILLHTNNHQFNLDFFNTPDFVAEIKAHSLKMLCHTFSQLIEQLPRHTTIVCILDGISELASRQWGPDEFSDVLLILNRLVTNQALRPAFKILSTTPFITGGTLIEQMLGSHYSLCLQPCAVYDGYGFSERSMPGLPEQARREDYFRRQMRANRERQMEEEDDDDDSDSDEDEDEGGWGG
ncbi:hypothetical protein BO70DRAFT_427502 [Aspergillus heteromorphus CBS 117.55]|uniref:Nephrocystin 3-like N-terminal domain-containing protein n=1 Tax=Aspergillus heteromorphus CBS 117.55 TaxID=1448321 RepID=A0A317WTL2_9EURO|nr:uncharacterized protein BO70DRAFT_427502 [Aspergillus heteromorphus CBS 117.55]PWY87580.1 hypothetical protein BO70DRAFT_427502 [Aspergillus heteromorphus CBS 117.55]